LPWYATSGERLLGTGGLIKAYKEAAADAIANAEVVEKTVDDYIDLHFEYPLLNEVMRILKQFDEVQWTQDFQESCRMRLQVRRSLSDQLQGMLSAIHGVTLTVDSPQGE